MKNSKNLWIIALLTVFAFAQFTSLHSLKSEVDLESEIDHLKRASHSH